MRAGTTAARAVFLYVGWIFSANSSLISNMPGLSSCDTRSILPLLLASI